ncbi:hypothetical protein [Luteibacter sp.]|jgi:hypothetical protein|uniref:hypothetical protein n=1 Tax=Luteibacter sp. TaxID=1886636 RepID=UPI002F428FB5
MTLHTWAQARLFAVSLLVSVQATGAVVVGVDVVSALQRERMERLGPVEALNRSSASMARDMLVDPASPYSEVQPLPAFVNDLAWPAALESLPEQLDDQQALDVIRWDLGMTRARPGVDIPVGAVHGYRDRFVAASAIKADVDADIFWHMLDLTGFRHSTKAAYYATGMQVLRNQMGTTEPAQLAALGIDVDVFRRVMQARSLSYIADHDLRYLSALVQHRLIHWQAGGDASTGLRELPMAFRIARVAAAYRDAEGYFVGSPCRPDGSPAANVAGTGMPGDPRDLCFVAATDRAVHRWYLDEVRAQAIPRRDRPEPNGLARLTGLLSLAFPLLEWVTAIEVVEAIIADDLVSAEALSVEDAEVASERADLISCRIPR